MRFLGELYRFYKLAKFRINAIKFGCAPVTREAHLLEYGEERHARVMGY